MFTDNYTPKGENIDFTEEIETNKIPSVIPKINKSKSLSPGKAITYGENRIILPNYKLSSILNTDTPMLSLTQNENNIDRKPHIMKTAKLTIPKLHLSSFEINNLHNTNLIKETVDLTNANNNLNETILTEQQLNISKLAMNVSNVNKNNERPDDKKLNEALK